MANVGLAEKRVPLDGRINVKVGDKVIDLRVSTLAYGSWRKYRHAYIGQGKFEPWSPSAWILF